MQNLRDHLLNAGDSLDPSRLPPRYDEAQSLMRDAISRAGGAAIPDTTVAAVLIGEALPRLIGAYGPAHTARILSMFARCIAADAPTGPRQ